jgi:hypothetical protein
MASLTQAKTKYRAVAALQARHLGDHWKKTVKEYKKQYQDARIHWKRLIQGVSKTPIPYI